MKNIPTELLRTFVTVIDRGGFTQAGQILGRTQPAISLQIKRLEELVDAPLLHRDKHLQVTEQGEMLLHFARQMLTLNDAAFTRIHKQQVSGQVRLGIPNDFEVSYLPSLLSQFTSAYPEVSLEVNCELSEKLLRDYDQGHYDLVLATATHNMDSDKLSSTTANIFVEPIVWVSNGHDIPDPEQAVPLVVYPQGCGYRQRIVSQLNQHNREWRVAYSSSSLLGITAAIQAGLGISAMAASTVPETLAAHSHLSGYPELGNMHIIFQSDPSNTSPACLRLKQHLQANLPTMPATS
ncbi:MAG: LysR substrate-binding domain-containing protein [Gammaproteobacteria bacterium]|jgi:DNA-binding transcriptional LysR family regulator|nr:LysR substrate-binding domain-containing protein [Gammaproteobacteria bacterium]